VEIWHFHAGATPVLSLGETDIGPKRDLRLGPDVMAGEAPQGIVPENWWQAAQTKGDRTLVSCTVPHGFRFEGFELAAPGFEIPG
jgi:uncharacterized protein